MLAALGKGGLLVWTATQALVLNLLPLFVEINDSNGYVCNKKKDLG